MSVKYSLNSNLFLFCTSENICTTGGMIFIPMENQKPSQCFESRRKRVIPNCLNTAGETHRKIARRHLISGLSSDKV